MRPWTVVILQNKNSFKKNYANCIGFRFGLDEFIIPEKIYGEKKGNEEILNSIIQKTKNRKSHLKNSDICGFIRESWGVKIPRLDGKKGFYDHIDEVNSQKIGLSNDLERLYKIQEHPENNHRIRNKCISMIETIQRLLAELNFIFDFVKSNI